MKQFFLQYKNNNTHIYLNLQQALTLKSSFDFFDHQQFGALPESKNKSLEQTFWQKWNGLIYLLRGVWASFMWALGNFNLQDLINDIYLHWKVEFLIFSAIFAIAKLLNHLQMNIIYTLIKLFKYLNLN